MPISKIGRERPGIQAFTRQGEAAPPVVRTGHFPQVWGVDGGNRTGRGKWGTSHPHSGKLPAVGYKPIGAVRDKTLMTMLARTLESDKGDIRLSTRKQPFNLLRWFSLISMAVIGTVAVAL